MHFWGEHWESNPGLLGEKQVCYLVCAMQHSDCHQFDQNVAICILHLVKLFRL